MATSIRPPNVNSVVISGRLVRDPEVKPIGESMVCNFTLAAGHRYQDKNKEWQEKVTFINVAAWGSTAESLGQRARKGTPVMVEGRLDMDSWTDKATGAKRSQVKIQASRVQVLEYQPKVQEPEIEEVPLD